MPVFKLKKCLFQSTCNETVHAYKLNYSGDAIHYLMEFMYCQQLVLPADIVPEVHKLSCILQIDALTAALEEFAKQVLVFYDVQYIYYIFTNMYFSG